MKIGRMVSAAAVLTLCSASAAMAGPKIMASPPANRVYPTTQTLWCDIVNLNTTAKDVTIEAMDYSGNVVTGPTGPITLNPNEGTAFLASSTQAAWCRFTVDGNTKRYRAVAIYDNGTNYTVAIPAY